MPASTHTLRRTFGPPTDALCACGTAEEVLALAAAHASTLSAVNLSTAFARVAKLGAPLPAAAQRALRADPRVRALGDAVAGRLGELSGRSLAGVTWAHAKLGHGPVALLAAAARHVANAAPKMSLKVRQLLSVPCA